MAEPRLALMGAAGKGRDIYRAVREQINRMRLQGIEPKCVWVGQDTVDAIHALWTAVAKEYDEMMPPEVAGVPMRLGMGLGRNQFQFEYDAKQDAHRELRRKPRDNPLPDND
jgi:hypothetical protein